MRNQDASNPKLVNRLNRRETRSSRAALSVTVAAVLLLAAVWLAVELTLSATGNAALLLPPAELAQRTVALPATTIPGALTAAGAAVALLGLALLAAAVLPGTKARHIVANPRSAVVVDAQVLASAAARAARTEARLAPEQVTCSVGPRRLDVVVSPVTGRAVDTAAVRAAVEDEVAGYGLRRALAVGVSLNKPGDKHGAVGA